MKNLNVKKPVLERNGLFCCLNDRGEIFNFLALCPKEKNEWTNHAIAWYKHAI